MTAPHDIDWPDRMAGRFIVFEGPDGSGKSLQFRRLADFFAERGVATCKVREPGGTAIGEQIRDVLLSPENEAMDLVAEMLLYMASRAQLVAERIAPALGRGEVVLADRFVSSTLAYQGTAGGLAPDDIRAVASIVCRDVQPDLVVIFDVDEATAARRLAPLLDRMEMKGRAFHARVREGYLEQARADPGRHLVIDASAEVDDVFDALLAGLAERCPDAEAAGGT